LITFCEYWNWLVGITGTGIVPTTSLWDTLQHIYSYI
jgi:hypothetical protein